MNSNGPTVMLVDDDDSVRKSLTRLFRSAGVELKSFASAEEFLDGSSINQASCLIADVQMPGMHGLELQTECLKRRPSLPIILITAFRDPKSERQALAKGAVAFLYKPLDGERLIDLVQQASQSAPQASPSVVNGGRPVRKPPPS
jgi:FixJ family two-component response regulator